MHCRYRIVRGTTVHGPWEIERSELEETWTWWGKKKEGWSTWKPIKGPYINLKNKGFYCYKELGMAKQGVMFLIKEDEERAARYKASEDFEPIYPPFDESEFND